jgi:hypothetical protein
MKAGIYLIYQWNGKDLFLQGRPDEFEVLSRQELPQHVVEKIQIGRTVSITEDGKITVVPTPQEVIDEIVCRVAKELGSAIATLQSRPIQIQVSQVTPVPPTAKPTQVVKVDLPTYRRRRKQLLESIEALKKYGDKDALATAEEEFKAYRKVL